MPRRYVFFLALTVSLVAADQWTKFVAVDQLTSHLDATEGLFADLGALYADPPAPRGAYHFSPRGQVEVIPGLLRLRYAENPGAAWGMFRGLPPQIRGPFFHLISLGAVVLIVWYFRKLTGAPEERWIALGLPLILGGALGNYIDRFSRAFVIDFIEAHWFDQAHWPSFNVADMAIVGGVFALVIDAFVRREKKAGA